MTTPILMSSTWDVLHLLADVALEQHNAPTSDSTNLSYTGNATTISSDKPANPTQDIRS